MAILLFFMKVSSAAELDAQPVLTLTSSSNTYGAKEGMLRACTQVVNYLIQICATDEVIAETDVALMRYTQRLNMFPTQ